MNQNENGQSGLVRVGTSGFQFKDWKGPFYPEKLPDAGTLDYYAAVFDIVEINTTYYRIPSPGVFARMAAAVPEDFGFTVKLHSSMTHERAPSPGDFAAFHAAMEPLAARGKLLGLLAQFPWSFQDTVENRDYLIWLRGQLAAYPLHVEFRHVSWITESGYEFLRRNRCGYAMVDEPQLKGLVPPVEKVIGPSAYVRLHGRNALDWWQPRPGSDRYLYEYSDEELAEWIPRVRRAAQKAKQTFIYFNNCHFGHAPRNALKFKQMLGLPEFRGVNENNDLILE